MSDLPSRFPHCHQLRPRYADTDAMGVVYYANYLTYFEVGRVEYLRAARTDYRSIEGNGAVAAVVEAHVTYAAPARFDDLLTICTSVVKIGKVRFRVEYEIWREADGKLIASGHTEHALLDRATLRPVRVPDDVRRAIEQFEATGRHR